MKNYFLDQRTITFLVSLLIAFGLWLLIKLSGDFQTENKVKLVFHNFPIDKVLINKPDSILQIKTNNNGFDVLNQSLFSKTRYLNINFRKAHFLNTRNNIQTYYILCSSLQQEVESKFEITEQILNIRPDSIIFQFEKLASKKLKIEPKINFSFKPRFKQYEKMKIEPDSLVFFGPASLLKSLTSISTQSFDFQNIDSNIDTLIPLSLPNNKLISKQESVKFQLAVEEYTERKIKLPIQLQIDNEVKYKIFPSEAQITFQVALKDYAKIKPIAFELIAIPDSSQSGKLLLKLSKQPKNIIVSNIQPAIAEYIIFK
ncbi:MAG: hypothetical protein DRI74_06155 [Bacteroidetes bacterium]|nr:MAG: hypothetical protein DRI74_06155 [Bacteroidota bacterium]